MHGKGLHMAAYWLVIIGGLNWLLIGLFSWGIENVLGSALSRIIYILVGLSAIYLIFAHKKSGMSGPKPMTPAM